MEWTPEELSTFIVEAHLATYTDPNAPRNPRPYRPGCEEYLYERGDWRYLDSYAWKRDGGGQEVVYFKGTPVWVMNYYGFLFADEEPEAIYTFLHEALREPHPVLPVRGNTHQTLEFFYKVDFERSTIGNFRGIERIYREDELAYECYLSGGFVR